MAVALGIPERNVYGNADAKAEPLALLGGKSARWALQTLGTQWGRMCMDSEMWVRAWSGRVNSLFDDEMIVADDLRFPNEVAEIKRRGGLVICVVRSMEDFSRQPQHESEDFGRLVFDGTLINNGDFQRLEHATLSLVELG
ncbi:putative deoxynucleotide monophosphate kinase [Hyphomicrobium sulfonivorans]|uniref:Putative deoxynucleotide monophosphate kinase n=2 Tax=Hyphomicrobium sulfonivorans TaxID=121290 RepID=A0A109BPE1_HYPSL|nr:putative deoxynucleotide monophosphate kinase [Hyphomicrobium sulfonivorans]